MAVKVGQIVFVHQIVMFGEDRWLPSCVMHVVPGGFAVKAMFGKFFDAEGKCDRMMLPNQGNQQTPKMWSFEQP